MKDCERSIESQQYKTVYIVTCSFVNCAAVFVVFFLHYIDKWI